MKISLDRVYRPLDIEIGEEGEEGHVIVSTRIDLRDSTISHTSALLIGAKKDIDYLQEELAKLGADDEDGEVELAKLLADAIRKPICSAIGDGAYDEILLALGDGAEPVPAEDANILMTQVFAEVMRVVMVHASKLKQNNAIHYLSDIGDNGAAL